MEEILVSIVCLTYNHENYIRDAIEGFFSQNVNFKYEIIIHDDASIDRTAEIIKKYEKDNPQVIHGIYQNENLWSKNQPSVKWIWDIITQNCKGKYIAFCEGDDYWIDKQKLQIQVDYLEKHSECIMAIHDSVDINYRKNHEVKSRGLYSKDCAVSPNHIIKQDVIVPTASILVRREVIKIDDFFLQSGILDYPMLLYCLTKGSIYYCSRIMSVYRFDHEGSWTASMRKINTYIIQYVHIIVFLKKYNDYCKGRYKKYVESKIQIQVNGIIGMIDQDIKRNYIEICDDCDDLLNNKYHEILEKIKNIWLQKNDERYVNKEVYNFVKNHKKILIMGAGKYAKIIAKQFYFNNINFEGYVISNNQKSVESVEYIYKKPVWKFKHLPYEINNIGIVIGINPVIWNEIIDQLEHVHAKNYICPFMLK